MKYEELEKELWYLNDNYSKYIQQTNHWELMPIAEILLLIAKILLFVSFKKSK
jgi:hypothetical protein